MNPWESNFTRIRDKVGNTESICLQCFATIARVRNIADLEELEFEHVCTNEQPEDSTPQSGPLPGT